MRVKPLILVPVIAVALAACSAQAPVTPKTTDAVVEKPLFSSDEEALAAAQAAYAHYLEVSDQIARDGGANPERLKGLVSSQLLQESEVVFETYISNAMHVEGSTKFDSLHLSEVTQSSASFYVCLDVGGTRILGSGGEDLTPDSRQSRLPILLELQLKNQEVVIESSEVWTGRNFC